MAADLTLGLLAAILTATDCEREVVHEHRVRHGMKD
jgi:hypothetical protein